jgi:hypothetical protein
MAASVQGAAFSIANPPFPPLVKGEPGRFAPGPRLLRTAYHPRLYAAYIGFDGGFRAGSRFSSLLRRDTLTVDGERDRRIFSFDVVIYLPPSEENSGKKVPLIVRFRRLVGGYSLIAEIDFRYFLGIMESRRNSGRIFPLFEG